MSGRIYVQALRGAEVIAPKPGSTTQWVPFVSIDHWQLLALLDAVEALRGLVATLDVEAQTGRGDVEGWWDRGSTALARFDFGGES